MLCIRQDRVALLPLHWVWISAQPRWSEHHEVDWEGVTIVNSERALRHVGIFLADLQGGGAERMMLNLARGLAEEGMRVDLLVANPAGPYLAEVPETVNFVSLHSGGVLQALPALAKYLRRDRPQVLLTTLHHSSVIALLASAIARTATPVFVREANTPSEGKVTLGQPKRWLSRRLIKLLYSRATGVIAVSKGVAADLNRYFKVPMTRIKVIYNPVVDDEIDRKARLEPGHPWLSPGAPPVVLGVGRLHLQKDFASLVRAFAKVRKKRVARLIILGEGEERGRLQSLIEELGLAQDVRMPGFVDNPFAFMTRSAVFVLSSRWEGLPGALIQAMACGCPVVATDCRSGPAEVLEQGRYGQLVPTGDVDALAEAIQDTLGADRRSEDLRSRSMDFSVTSVVRLYIEYLENYSEPSADAASFTFALPD